MTEAERRASLEGELRGLAEAQALARYELGALRDEQRGLREELDFDRRRRAELIAELRAREETEGAALAKLAETQRELRLARAERDEAMAASAAELESARAELESTRDELQRAVAEREGELAGLRWALAKQPMAPAADSDVIRRLAEELEEAAAEADALEGHVLQLRDGLLSQRQSGSDANGPSRELLVRELRDGAKEAGQLERDLLELRAGLRG